MSEAWKRGLEEMTNDVWNPPVIFGTIWHGCQQMWQTNYGSSCCTCAQWFSHLKINEADDHDVIIMMSPGSLVQ